MTAIALAACLVLTLVAAVLRAGGASLVRTTRADALHDAAEGDVRAIRVARLLEERNRLQPALGMVHTTLLVLSAVLGVWAFSRMFDGWQLLLALGGLGIVMAVGGDFLPRGYGRAHPGRFAYRFSGLVAVAVALGDRASDVIQEEPEPVEEPPVDQVEAEERALISQVLEFTDTIVREVMVPRPDMITVGDDATLNDVLDTVIGAGKSRLPVVGAGRDDIVGIIYAKDLLALLRPEAEVAAEELPKREAYFVPETKRVSELLREMQASQIHLAVVVDEFGGTAGLVTIEDLIEELVGEIVDEYDVEEPLVTPIDGGGYLVDGRLGLDELGALIGIDFPDEEWDTVGGLLLGLAGRIPREGEAFELEDFLLVADQVQGRRVGRIRVAPR